MCGCNNVKYKGVRFGEVSLGINDDRINLDGKFQFELVNNSPDANLVVNKRTVIEPGDSWSPPCNNMGLPFIGELKFEFTDTNAENVATLYFIEGVECDKT